jgi:hypothetical protein
MDNVQVNGNIDVKVGATLIVRPGSTVMGDIRARRDREVDLGGVSVTGNVRVSRGGQISFQENTISGNVLIAKNRFTSGATFVDNDVSGDVTFKGNTGTPGSSVQVASNTIGGDLLCKGNGPGVIDTSGGNSVRNQNTC